MKKKNYKPPKAAAWLLERMVEYDMQYSAMGDFEEQFYTTVENRNIVTAHFIYWLQVAAVLPAFFKNII